MDWRDRVRAWRVDRPAPPTGPQVGRWRAPRWIGVLVGWALVACSAVVQSDLSEDEANQLVLALHSAGVDSFKESTPSGGAPRWSVSVAPDDMPTALAILRAEALPHHDASSLTEVSGSSNLVPSPVEERARLAAVLSAELSATLESMDGVVSARVHLSLPTDVLSALDAPNEPPRASVLIRYRGDSVPFDSDSIKALVAGSIAGMKAENVTLVAAHQAASPPIESPLVHIGPIAVARASATPLRIILGASLSVNLLLAIALATLATRRRARLSSSISDSESSRLERKATP